MAQIVELLLGTLDKVTITGRPCYLSFYHNLVYRPGQVAREATT